MAPALPTTLEIAAEVWRTVASVSVAESLTDASAMMVANNSVTAAQTSKPCARKGIFRICRKVPIGLHSFKSWRTHSTLKMIPYLCATSSLQ